MREEHGAELEAKKKAEFRLRSVEAQLVSEREDSEETAMRLDSEQRENKKVSGFELERTSLSLSMRTLLN